MMPTPSLLPDEILLQLAAADTDGEPVATEKAVRSLTVTVALEVRPMGGDGEGAVPRSRRRGQPTPCLDRHDAATAALGFAFALAVGEAKFLVPDSSPVRDANMKWVL